MLPRGFRRSRALWENCRNPYFLVDTNSTDGLKRQRIKFLQYARAILYELQPIRYSVMSSNISTGYRYVIQLASTASVSSRKWIPYSIKQVIHTFQSLSWNQWKWIIFIALYYIFVRWIHEALDAGPVVLIVTLLVLIFTVGLSDQNDMSGLSAYSVFNKGFQKIMGSIDADDLLQQHLGGGGLMQMIHQQRPQMDDDIIANNRQQRHAQQRNLRQHRNNNLNDVDDDQERPADINFNQNRARRTGKKARRDRAAIEQRREIRAQRDAALAMGFAGNNNDNFVVLDRDVADVQNEN